MSKRKKKTESSPDYYQLSLDLFGDDSNYYEQPQKTSKKKSPSIKDREPSLPEGSPNHKAAFNVDNPRSEKSSYDKNKRLFLPLSYEEIIIEVGSSEKKSRLPDIIVPVPEFETQIIQIIADIRNSGHLVFLYGPSGVGKSTFIMSLQFQAHIQIKEIFSINTSELVGNDSPSSKLPKLFKEIYRKATSFFEKNTRDGDKLCIVIDYLEDVNGEDENTIKAFFRDLNGLLRKHGILIIWPVTDFKDLEKMSNFAKSFSTTMFHGRIPIIYFTGPPLLKYPSIAKKAIKFFNDGKECYEFQLQDNDFESLKESYEKKPSAEHNIRDY